jgi:hypothetical protein
MGIWPVALSGMVVLLAGCDAMGGTSANAYGPSSYYDGPGYAAPGYYSEPGYGVPYALAPQWGTTRGMAGARVAGTTTR